METERRGHSGSLASGPAMTGRGGQGVHKGSPVRTHGMMAPTELLTEFSEQPTGMRGGTLSTAYK